MVPGVNWRVTSIPKSPIRVSGESRSWERFRLDCAVLTAPGAGRPSNEDHVVFAAPGDSEAERAEAGYLFAVIDGVAEGGNGRSAARETGTSLLEILDDPRRTSLRPDLIPRASARPAGGQYGPDVLMPRPT